MNYLIICIAEQLTEEINNHSQHGDIETASQLTDEMESENFTVNIFLELIHYKNNFPEYSSHCELIV